MAQRSAGARLRPVEGRPIAPSTHRNHMILSSSRLTWKVRRYRPSPADLAVRPSTSSTPAARSYSPASTASLTASRSASSLVAGTSGASRGALCWLLARPRLLRRGAIVTAQSSEHGGGRDRAGDRGSDMLGRNRSPLPDAQVRRAVLK